jgi:fructokinase
VVDTIGAGDAFQAGLLSGLAATDRLGVDAIAELSDSDMRFAMDRALTVAALTCTRAGADPPTQADCEQFTASRLDDSRDEPRWAGGGGLPRR